MRHVTVGLNYPWIARSGAQDGGSPGIGTNKRYADSIDRRSLEQVYRRAMVGDPDSLSENEIALHEEPLTTYPKPEKVRAWVRYGRESVRVNAYVLASTRWAARVRWQEPNGTRREAWVWTSAVRDSPWVSAD